MAVKPITVDKLAIVTRKRGRLKRQSLQVLVFLLLVLGAFVGGRVQERINQAQKIVDNQLCKTRVETLVSATDELRLQSVSSQMNITVAQGAQEHLRRENKNLQDEIAELNQALAFYKSIMAPTQTKGLRLENFSLLSTSEPRQFRYLLTLTQVADNRYYISGQVNASITGSLNGKKQTLKLTDISPDFGLPNKFRFRYYQKIEGLMTLPEDFTPIHVDVHINPSSNKNPAITEQYSWLQLTGISQTTQPPEPANEQIDHERQS